MRVEKPKQYQQGWTEFYRLKFLLTTDSLIPRPETELLVDEVLALSENIDNPMIMDLGTGSGNVAVAIAKNLPDAKIIATDISKEALEVAKKNIKLHYCDDRIIIVAADLLEGFRKAPDIIVTNLPYIPTARLKYIDPMVTEWEPKVALDGGIDGFELYRKLFNQITEKKLFPKYLIGEIDYTQADFVYSEVRRFFPSAQVEVKHDLAKKQRYFVIKF